MRDDFRGKMDPDERVALVNRMVDLVDQLYILETCCPQTSGGSKNTSQINNSAQANNCTPMQDCAPCYPAQNRAPKAHQYCIPQPRTDRNSYGGRASPPKTQEEPKRSSLQKYQPHKCQTDPDKESWTPVLEIRKTTNAKNLERQNDEYTTKYVFLEPPGCPYKPVWSTKDPMCEKHCGPPEGCPAQGPPPGYNGASIQQCYQKTPVGVPGGKGPPVDRWGQPYDSKQTIDGRVAGKYIRANGLNDAVPSDWCDAMTSSSRRCDAEEDDPRKILMRGKVLNQRFSVSNDQANGNRSTNMYKRPVYPGMDTCDDGRCKCPNNSNMRNSRQPY